MLENFIFELICFRFIYQTWFVITFIRTLLMKSIYELYVICSMYVESCTILVVVNHLSRPVVVLDGLPGLYGFKYDSAAACGPPLYLYSYKLVSSTTAASDGGDTAADDGADGAADCARGADYGGHNMVG